eukprot:2787100-Rhodomonas_salina.2
MSPVVRETQAAPCQHRRLDRQTDNHRTLDRETERQRDSHTHSQTAIHTDSHTQRETEPRATHAASASAACPTPPSATARVTHPTLSSLASSHVTPTANLPHHHHRNRRSLLHTQPNAPERQTNTSPTDAATKRAGRGARRRRAHLGFRRAPSLATRSSSRRSRPTPSPDRRAGARTARPSLAQDANPASTAARRRRRRLPPPPPARAHTKGFRECRAVGVHKA